ncbi:hypothetical protein RHSIM_Rhsim03G0118100 [Rhododendron simsii]|uniref:SWIM-type domain-containing protein n=1 Tax=Rhododendron simsii TaxID=118357 RepID=A0A834H9D1_RHOSS|nr:hypothetical protein RHSIM_Rhsim03G0118100 [Rhododendron simsii]
MSIRLDREKAKYVVYSFNAAHNHDLQNEETAHMLPLHRNISAAQAYEVDLADDSGIRLKSAHEFMGRQAGGMGNLGYTQQDHKNYLRSKRQTNLEYGEAGAILDYFEKQTLENPSFYSTVQLDLEEKITNIFWADAKMIIDYSHFETIIFGAALLYDETAASFEWLFNTFFTAMSGKRPKTIFTDQDAAMAKAIPLVMPETYHRICTWHMRQNAMKHLGYLYKEEDSEFAEHLHAFINDILEEDEFLSAWDAMVSKYDLEDLDLAQFFKHFEREVDNKRYNELKAEYNLRQKLPRKKMNTPMLTQAGEVYTSKVFEKFQAEYEVYQAAYIEDRINEGLPTSEYTVAILGQPKTYKVLGNRSEQTVSCSCCKFEAVGILCSHALKVLDVMDIKLIPERYILKRWTRDAKAGIVKDFKGREVEGDNKLKVTNRYRMLCPELVKLASRAAECEEASALVASYMIEMFEKVEDILKNKRDMDESTNEGQDSPHEAPLENFVAVQPKGLKKKQAPRKGNKRPKSWTEKQGKKKKGGSAEVVPNEESFHGPAMAREVVQITSPKRRRTRPDSDPASASDSNADSQDSPPQWSHSHRSRRHRDSKDSDDGRRRKRSSSKKVTDDDIYFCPGPISHVGQQSTGGRVVRRRSLKRLLNILSYLSQIVHRYWERHDVRGAIGAMEKWLIMLEAQLHFRTL